MLIGHHNLPGELPWAVSMVRNTFTDDIGNVKTITGTGFWIRTEDGHIVFATNRHNVDPALAFHPDPVLCKLQIQRTEVHVRRNASDFLAYEPGQFFPVVDPQWACDPQADAAILIDASLELGPDGDERYRAFVTAPESLLADGGWTNQRLQMMDECYFIGYPSVPSADGKPVHFYDVAANFPIARQAIIASGPFYTHKDIKTVGVILVSGMSFHGSSGSPVITPVLGIPPGSVTTAGRGIARDAPVTGDSRESRIIGIMTGKFETKEIDRVFTHAGLSYFTRAGYILGLIKQARAAGWERVPA